MRIVTVRRITQGFFLLLAVWFAVVASYGDAVWQLRGWPVGWLLELDPLVAVATVLATGALYAGLAWALLTIVLTLVLGRVFCGWVCPLGTVQHIAGWLGRRRRRATDKVAMNRPHTAQRFKYYVLLWLLVAAAGNGIARLARASVYGLDPVAIGVAVALLGLAGWVAYRISKRPLSSVLVVALGASVWLAAARLAGTAGDAVVSLQTGLLDPIPLFFRTLSLVLLPAVDGGANLLWTEPRFMAGAWVVGAIFIAIVLVAAFVPRFYCRYVCPVGALLGLVGRKAPWRVGRDPETCIDCKACERDCEGACQPSGTVNAPECVVCMSCTVACPTRAVTFSGGAAADEVCEDPGMTRRGVVTAAVAGLLTTPFLRIGGRPGPLLAPGVIRPPGALAEDAFLARCIKCGQCMRVCPTGVLQPAGLEAGAEGIWTPVLDNRVGTSACHPLCVACGYVCPTAAIRRLSRDERNGKGIHADAGPIRIGLSFVDRGRCLPWAMDKPCLVCEENCPVSPKAIFLREEMVVVRDGRRRLLRADGYRLELEKPLVDPLAAGDHYVRLTDGSRHRIALAEAQTVLLEQAPTGRGPGPGDEVALEARLLRPYVDARRCVGCGICEHVCPVAGTAAIRVTSTNESREPGRVLTL